LFGEAGPGGHLQVAEHAGGGDRGWSSFEDAGASISVSSAAMAPSAWVQGAPVRAEHRACVVPAGEAEQRQRDGDAA
jgi:hypothetical protein